MKLFGRKAPPMPEALNLDQVEAVWFDLDGTLVDVDMHAFVPAYLRRLACHMTECADPRATARVMRTAVQEMLRCEQGEVPLEQILLEHLERSGIERECYRQGLSNYCRDDLAELEPLVRPHPLSRALLETCRNRGWRLVLATNPIFPRVVIDARLDWGGLSDLPFEHVTSYETAMTCKPHRSYFESLLDELGLTAGNCLMVGNDTEHDMAAGRVGMITALLTTWRIDRFGVGFDADWQGTHAELMNCLQPAGDAPQASS